MIRHRHYTWLLFAFLLALAHISTPADAARRAIVIGIDGYEHIPRLNKARNDAKAMAQRLRDLQFEVIVLTDIGKVQFQKGWAEFLNSLEAGDTLLIYFAGHGIQIDGLNYLILRDTPDPSKGEEVIRAANIGFHDLMSQVEVRKPKASFWILDACRNNPFGGTAKSKAIGEAKGLARLESVFGTFIMYSAGPDEEALDGLSGADKDPNSVYTRRLLPLLPNKEVSIVELAKRIQIQVEEDARTKATHQQRPAYFDGILGHYNLATDAVGSGTLLLVSDEEWVRHPRVMWIDYRPQIDYRDCSSLTPPRITVVTPPKYGRIVMRYATFTVGGAANRAFGTVECQGKQARGWGIYYVMDEEHRDKKFVENVTIRAHYFYFPKLPKVTFDYVIDPATRSRTVAITK